MPTYTGVSDTDLPTHVKKLTTAERRRWLSAYSATKMRGESTDFSALVAANTAVSAKKRVDGEFGSVFDLMETLSRARADHMIEKRGTEFADNPVVAQFSMVAEDIVERFSAVEPPVGAGNAEFYSALSTTASASKAVALPFDTHGRNFRHNLSALTDRLDRTPAEEWDAFDAMAAESVNKYRLALTNSILEQAELAPAHMIPALVAAGMPIGPPKTVKAFADTTDTLMSLADWFESDIFGMYGDVPADLPVMSVKMFKTAPSDDDIRKRVVVGIVLVPDEVDLQDDIISAPEIELAAHQFMLNKGEVGINHTEFPQGAATVVESFLAPHDLTLGEASVRPGSWVIAVKIFDDDLLKRVEDGELTGFSIGGTAQSRELF